MRIVSTELCRGDGKLFFRCSLSGVDETALVAFRAYTLDGRSVAAMVFDDELTHAVGPYSADRRFVVSLPLVERPLCFVCFAFAPDGSLLDQAQATFEPSVVKWQGRLTTALSHGGDIALRNCDRSCVLDRVTFKVWDYLLPTWRDGILRATAYVPQALCSEPPELHCYDTSLNELPGKLTLMSCRTVKESEWMSAPLWELSFSLVLSGDEQTVICEAECSGECLQGFEVFEADQLRDFAARSAYHYDNAQWCAAYHEWFLARRAQGPKLELQRRRGVQGGPTFSVVVPLFRTPPVLFEEMLASVLAQTYERFELVLVNASPEDAELAAAVRSAQARDPRVVVVDLEGNGGITLNTAAGVDKATGDYVCFLDHDDVLEPDVLYEYALAVAGDPDIDLLYCDEDKLDANGRYCQPYFKTDFSIDLLRSNNYVCHLLTVRKTLLEELPWRSSRYDGAQDHNLVLMVSEVSKHIHHVPKVLYHWRIAEGSTAGGEENKPYALQAGIRVVQDHLDRVGLPARVGPAFLPFTYRVDYEVVGNPLVSIVIPNKDHADLLDACLTSIAEKSTYDAYEVVVVENNSVDDATFAYYEQAQATWDRVRVVRWDGEGFNFSAIMNYGVEQARGDYLLCLNNDIEVITPEWIELMLGVCQRADVGAVGARLYYPDDTIQHAGVGITGDTAEHLGKFLTRDDQGYFGLLNLMRDVSCVTAACMMTSRDAFDSVGGFETDLAVAYNDVDYCLKLRDRDLLVVMNPYVELYHYESISRGMDNVNDESEARVRAEAAYLHRRWARLFVEGDPYLNPNLNNRIPFARYYRLRDY